MAITYITPVEITPGTASAWTDVDVSAYVPAGATGVVISVKNNSSNWHTVGFRNNGSTDGLPPGSYNHPSHLDWYCVGIDSNRILELYTSSTTEIDIHLVGYFASNTTAKFFVNCIVKTPATTLVWVDVNIAGDTGTDTAIAAIGYIGISNWSYGVRNNGSTDGRVVSDGYRYYRGGFVVGVDANEIFEVWVGHSVMTVRLQGYIISNATFYVNAIDKSLSSTGVWLDLSALPDGATGGFFEVFHTVYNTQLYYGLRKNGDATEIYGSLYRRSLSVVECDSSFLIEGKISNTAVGFFLVGYSTAAAGGPPVYLEALPACGLAAGGATDLSAGAALDTLPASGFAVGSVTDLAFAVLLEALVGCGAALAAEHALSVGVTLPAAVAGGLAGTSYTDLASGMLLEVLPAAGVGSGGPALLSISVTLEAAPASGTAAAGDVTLSIGVRLDTTAAAGLASGGYADLSRGAVLEALVAAAIAAAVDPEFARSIEFFALIVRRLPDPLTATRMQEVLQAAALGDPMAVEKLKEMLDVDRLPDPLTVRRLN